MKNMSEKEYENSTAVNYSLLKLLNDHPLKAKNYIDKTYHIESDSLTWGSLIDCLLTCPKELENIFYITEENKLPKDKMKLWADQVWLLSKENINLIDDNIILESRKIAEYDARLKNDSAIEKFKKEAIPYINILNVAEKKEIITIELLNEANSVIEKVKSNKFLIDFFNKRQTDNSIVEFQYCLNFDLNVNNIQTLCKAKIDQLIINNDMAIIIDYKTCKSIDDFIDSYKKYRYYLQAAMYCEAIKTIKTIKYITFYFITINRNGNVLIYNVSQEGLHRATYGFDEDNNHIKGLYELIEDFNFHKTNDLWDYKREQYKNNGIIEII